MKYILIAFFTLISLTSFSQTKFINSGKITFARTVGQYTIIESMSDNGEADPWFEDIKKFFPKLVVDNFVLEFNDNKSLYKIEKENSENKYIVQNLKPTEVDFVSQQLNDDLVVMKRTVFENEYLVKDSLIKYEWKITGEVRDIAGFECKKATTKICDSVVVVAFYTDQIPVKAGPENFNGLPGMIMGLAVPRLATTWFATKLELQSPVIGTVETLSKGKPVQRAQINKDLNKGLSGWGKMGKIIVWIASL